MFGLQPTNTAITYCKQIVSVIQKNLVFSIKSSFFSVIWKKIIISLSTYQLGKNVCWITTHMYFDIDGLLQLNFLYFSSGFLEFFYC